MPYMRPVTDQKAKSARAGGSDDTELWYWSLPPRVGRDRTRTSESTVSGIATRYRRKPAPASAPSDMNAAS